MTDVPRRLRDLERERANRPTPKSDLDAVRDGTARLRQYEVVIAGVPRCAKAMRETRAKSTRHVSLAVATIKAGGSPPLLPLYSVLAYPPDEALPADWRESLDTVEWIATRALNLRKLAPATQRKAIGERGAYAFNLICLGGPQALGLRRLLWTKVDGDWQLIPDVEHFEAWPATVLPEAPTAGR